MQPRAKAAAIMLMYKQLQQRHSAARLALLKRQRSHAVAAVLAAAAEPGSYGRRTVERTKGGWRCSTLQGYLNGDEVTYKLNFRATKANVTFIAEKLAAGGYLRTNKNYNPEYCIPTLFKVGVVMYFMAHCKGDRKTAGDVASLGKSTVDKYLDEFCRGACTVLKPIFMPSTPPSAESVQRVREGFAGRRGVPNVAMAVDGSHCPYNGGP